MRTTEVEGANERGETTVGLKIAKPSAAQLVWRGIGTFGAAGRSFVYLPAARPPSTTRPGPGAGCSDLQMCPSGCRCPRISGNTDRKKNCDGRCPLPRNEQTTTATGDLFFVAETLELPSEMIPGGPRGLGHHPLGGVPHRDPEPPRRGIVLWERRAWLWEPTRRGGCIGHGEASSRPFSCGTSDASMSFPKRKKKNGMSRFGFVKKEFSVDLSSQTAECE